MFNINGLELLLIGVLFLILFGPDRLPSVVVDLMNVVRQLRSAAEAATEDLTREFQAAAREVRETRDTLTQAGTEIRAEVSGIGEAARGALDEAAMPSIAPPSLAPPGPEPPSRDARDEGDDGGDAEDGP